MTTKKPCKRTRFNNLHWSFKFYPKTFCLAANGRVLTNSITAPNFADVINASAAGSNGSVIYGYGGNDALSGSSGKDDIFGGDGDDLIGGGQGSDTIKGGAGNDHINSSATLDVAQRMRPSDSWSPPAGQEVLARGPLWGIYLDNDVGGPATVWSGSNNPLGSDGDVIDGVAGNDTYQLKSSELFDVITDSDGNGTNTVDGVQLTGGKKAAEGSWISDDKQWGYVLSSTGDLTISKGSNLHDGLIIVDCAVLQEKNLITKDQFYIENKIYQNINIHLYQNALIYRQSLHRANKFSVTGNRV